MSGRAGGEGHADSFGLAAGGLQLLAALVCCQPLHSPAKPTHPRKPRLTHNLHVPLPACPAVVHVIDNVLLPVNLGLAGPAVEQHTKSAAHSSALASVAALATTMLAAAMLV